MAGTSEDEIALGVLRIAAAQIDGRATFERLYADIPRVVNLTRDDWKGSTTRNGEPMWHQIVRNIQSHHTADGNFIQRGLLEHVPGKGYSATPKGRAYLKALDL